MDPLKTSLYPKENTALNQTSSNTLFPDQKDPCQYISVCNSHEIINQGLHYQRELWAALVNNEPRIKDYAETCLAMLTQNGASVSAHLPDGTTIQYSKDNIVKLNSSGQKISTSQETRKALKNELSGLIVLRELNAFNKDQAEYKSLVSLHRHSPNELSQSFLEQTASIFSTLASESVFTGISRFGNLLALNAKIENYQSSEQNFAKQIGLLSNPSSEGIQSFHPQNITVDTLGMWAKFVETRSPIGLEDAQLINQSSVPALHTRYTGNTGHYGLTVISYAGESGSAKASNETIPKSTTPGLGELLQIRPTDLPQSPKLKDGTLDPSTNSTSPAPAADHPASALIKELRQSCKNYPDHQPYAEVLRGLQKALEQKPKPDNWERLQQFLKQNAPEAHRNQVNRLVKLINDPNTPQLEQEQEAEKIAIKYLNKFQTLGSNPGHLDLKILGHEFFKELLPHSPNAARDLIIEKYLDNPNIVQSCLPSSQAIRCFELLEAKLTSLESTAANNLMGAICQEFEKYQQSCQAAAKDANVITRFEGIFNRDQLTPQEELDGELKPLIKPENYQAIHTFWRRHLKNEFCSAGESAQVLPAATSLLRLLEEDLSKEDHANRPYAIEMSTIIKSLSTGRKSHQS